MSVYYSSVQFSSVQFYRISVRLNQIKSWISSENKKSVLSIDPRPANEKTCSHTKPTRSITCCYTTTTNVLLLSCASFVAAIIAFPPFLLLFLCSIKAITEFLPFELTFRYLSIMTFHACVDICVIHITY